MSSETSGYTYSFLLEAAILTLYPLRAHWKGKIHVNMLCLLLFVMMLFPCHDDQKRSKFSLQAEVHNPSWKTTVTELKSFAYFFCKCQIAFIYPKHWTVRLALDCNSSSAATSVIRVPYVHKQGIPFKYIGASAPNLKLLPLGGLQSQRSSDSYQAQEKNFHNWIGWIQSNKNTAYHLPIHLPSMLGSCLLWLGRCASITHYAE